MIYRVIPLTLLFFFNFVLLSPGANAQKVSDYYSLTLTTETYTAGFPSGEATPANIFPLNWDDDTYTGYKLPFDFNFNGTVYTAANGYIGLNTNGWFCFSNGEPTMTGTDLDGSWTDVNPNEGKYLYGNANNNGFAGFNANLKSQAFPTFTGKITAGSKIITQVSSFSNIQVGLQLSATGIPRGAIVTSFNIAAQTITISANAGFSFNTVTITPYSSIYAFTRGTAPHRQYVVQWTGAKRATSVRLEPDTITFQMILNEGGGVAADQKLMAIWKEVPRDAVGTNVQVGLRGSTRNDFNAARFRDFGAFGHRAVAATNFIRVDNQLPTSLYSYSWTPCTTIPGPTPGAFLGGAVLTTLCSQWRDYYGLLSSPADNVPGAAYYVWRYTGVGATFDADTTRDPGNFVSFDISATSGDLIVTPVNRFGQGASISVNINIGSHSTATLSYPPSFCQTSPVFNHPTLPFGGTFSTPSPELSLDASTGAINPAASTPGEYIVEYKYTYNSCTFRLRSPITIYAKPTVNAVSLPTLNCDTKPLQANVLESNWAVAQIPAQSTGLFIDSANRYFISSNFVHKNLLFRYLVDDEISQPIKLPFTFNYYGRNIDTVYLSTNGYLLLGKPSPALGVATPILSVNQNMIAAVWCNLKSNGTLPMASYHVFGKAPNRLFVIRIANAKFAPSGTGSPYAEIRLKESDNSIVVAVDKITGGGVKTMGLANEEGSGTTVPGRDFANWTVSGKEAWRFLKESPYDYSWSPTTYLDNPNISNPLASNITAPITYTVRVTSLVTGCYSDATVYVTPVLEPLAGTYTVGAGGDYPTISAAVNAYNTRCQNGAVTFLLTDNEYKSPAENFPITIKYSVSRDTTYPLVIKPAPGKNVSIIGNAPNAIFILDNAQYVTIDGSNTEGGLSRNLNIINQVSSPTPSSSVITMCMTSALAEYGPGFNVVKNCNLLGDVGSKVQNGVRLGWIYANLVESNEVRSRFNTVFNNRISNVRNGIHFYHNRSSFTGEKKDLIGFNVIDSNEIAPAEAGVGDELRIGIIANYQNNIRITRNYIHDIQGSEVTGQQFNVRGIITGIITNSVIKGNRIDSISNPTLNSLLTPVSTAGIYIAGEPVSIAFPLNAYNYNFDANLLIANNFISRIKTEGSVSTPQNNRMAVGIYVDKGNGYKLYANSVSLTQSTYSPTTALFVSSNGTVGAVDLKNNILANFTPVYNPNFPYAVEVASTNQVFTAMDYNVYHSSSNSLVNWANAVTYSSLAELQNYFFDNTHSKVVVPSFISAGDLHLTAIGNNDIMDAGTPLLGVETDVDNQTRNPINPEIGADEIIKANQAFWVGSVSEDWADPKNWELNFVPTSNTSTYIKGGFTHMPKITATQAVRNLFISSYNPSDPPVLDIDGGTLQVYGTMNNAGGTILGLNGTLEMKGASSQTIAANLFYNNALLHLVNSNKNLTNGLQIGGPLDIYGSVTFTGDGRLLKANGNLTFKSTATGTAWLGLLNRQLIEGDVVVERFIGTGVGGALHNKSWQLLGVPVLGTQTIQQAWQEGATTPNGNPMPGFGTQLTGNLPNALSLGFDVFTPNGSSIKTYNSATNEWTGVANTITTPIANTKGYMVFVRGDRSVTTPLATATPTVLRVKGQPYIQGFSNPPLITVTAGKMESVPNPLISAIDFRNAVKTNVSDIYYLWDPRLTAAGNSAYGLGGYQTFTKDAMGDYRVTPGGGSFGPGGSVNNIIQSGAAFFVQSNKPIGGANGTIRIVENAKVSGSTLVNRETVPQNNEIRVNLHVMQNGEPILIDGVLAQFDNVFNNEVDGDDAKKMQNTGENLAIRKDAQMLSVERRKMVTAMDTLFLNTANMRIQNYRFELKGSNWLPGMQAWLVDSYTGQRTELLGDGDVEVNFDVVNHPGAYAPYRFYIVFKPISTLPVRRIALSGMPYRNDANRLQWDVEGETDMASYQLERSEDGGNYNQIATHAPVNPAHGRTTYYFIDTRLPGDINYYRVRAVSISGQVQYSNIVALKSIKHPVRIGLYPNPTTGTSSLSYDNLEKGEYMLQIHGILGQQIIRKKIWLEEDGVYKLSAPLNKGSYRVSLYNLSGDLIWMEWWIKI